MIGALALITFVPDIVLFLPRLLGYKGVRRMLGKAAVAMWWDISPEMRAEWEDWHTHEHMPERLGIPGFLRGTRWVADSGEPRISFFMKRGA